MTNAQRAKTWGTMLKAKLAKATDEAAKKASAYLVARVKEVVSVPVPVPYRRAIYRKPPRRDTGNLLAKVSARRVAKGKFAIEANAKRRGFNYGRYHERRNPSQPMSGRHPFIRPTAIRYRDKLGQIAGETIRVEINRWRI
jgi:hypothetical protein